ncbi:MFS transporter [Natronoflexus pectinivorans]|uniref:Sugar (Glycoside-pentoside-hexuronide) transporter n=1 Tax=Natronoflexus pectinivorans TaxID=682526 RepID=A0A4R2GMV8_9BACT|nr:MFS transporter [Natronoflexus pectinivorans]TCO10380.1 sugar (glycoside-pentoside-hexuronide) transporter [Natronoflexus pectinivorans]
MSSATEKISVKEKIGYSLGDFAANLIFQTLMTFLAYFYTDVFKIQGDIAAVIIFVGGMTGAFFTPIMGVIADRTNTRWGKFRPWILWTSVPFGVIALLAFTTPNFSPSGRIAYALITYILLVIVYTANNLPYATLSGVLTGNMSERNSISSYRFTAVTVAQFIIQVILLPLVLIVGDGDRAVGFEYVMGIFAFIGVVCFIITFLTTKERIAPPAEQKTSVKQDLIDLSKNRPWVIMLIVTIFIFITLALKGGNYIYYFENYLSQNDLNEFLQFIGFFGVVEGFNSFLIGMGLTPVTLPEDPASIGFGIFNGSGIILMIIAIALSKPIADKYGKRDLFIVALSVATLSQFLFLFIPAQNVGWVFICQIVHGFSYGLTIPLLWAMIADVADWSEWKNNRRATAIIFSAMLFGLKAGLAIGGSLVAAILSFYGYQPPAEGTVIVQSEQAINGILMTMSVYPAITFLVALVALFFYEINKSTEVLLEGELGKRRQEGLETLEQENLK